MQWALANHDLGPVPKDTQVAKGSHLQANRGLHAGLGRSQPTPLVHQSYAGAERQLQGLQVNSCQGQGQILQDLCTGNLGRLKCTCGGEKRPS